MSASYSLLKLCPKPGSIGVALGQQIAALKPGVDGARLELLRRVSLNTKPVERMAMLAEIHRCRRRMRSWRCGSPILLVSGSNRSKAQTRF